MNNNIIIKSKKKTPYAKRFIGFMRSAYMRLGLGGLVEFRYRLWERGFRLNAKGIYAFAYTHNTSTRTRLYVVLFRV